MDKTNWEDYYKRPYKASGITRSITTKRLIRYINEYVPKNDQLEIVELGGANSCFFDNIVSQVAYGNYCVIDNNDLGLEKFKERVAGNSKVSVCNQDILNLNTEMKADFVFSVGLIEHFDAKQTKLAIEAHFRLLKPGGIALISFPTPTFLYKISRAVSELLGMWIFHDERPLKKEEVFPVVDSNAYLQQWQIIWPIFFTQLMLVAKKKTSP